MLLHITRPGAPPDARPYLCPPERGKGPASAGRGFCQGKKTYTHPPAKVPRRITIRISIHAPIRGRPCWDAVIRSVSEFQSTPPYGSDHCRFFYFFVCSISIHAPIRGRLLYVLRCNGLGQFQSTPPYGGDEAVKADVDPKEFQSTPPCGGDGHAPHTPLLPLGISIHAPLRGRQRVGAESHVAA